MDDTDKMFFEKIAKIIGFFVVTALIFAVPILTPIAIIYQWFIAPFLIVCSLGEFALTFILLYIFLGGEE